MALTIKSIVSFEVKDGANFLFQSGQRIDQPAGLDEAFAGKLDVPDGTVDVEVPMIGVTSAKRIFAVADKAITIKLVPTGSVLGDVPGLKLVAGVPILVAAASVIKIYLSNDTGEDATAVVAGVGDDS